MQIVGPFPETVIQGLERGPRNLHFQKGQVYMMIAAMTIQCSERRSIKISFWTGIYFYKMGIFALERYVKIK